jgi:hypothetical protein
VGSSLGSLPDLESVGLDEVVAIDRASDGVTVAAASVGARDGTWTGDGASVR